MISTNQSSIIGISLLIIVLGVMLISMIENKSIGIIIGIIDVFAFIIFVKNITEIKLEDKKENE